MRKKPVTIVYLLTLNCVYSSDWGIKAGSNYSFIKNTTYSMPGVDKMFGISKAWA